MNIKNIGYYFLSLALVGLTALSLPNPSFAAEKSSATVGKGSIISKRVWLTAYSRPLAHQIRLQEIRAKQAR